MKYILPLLATISISCASGRAAVAAHSPDRLADYDAAVEAESKAKADYEAAVATPDPDDDAPALQAFDDATNAVAEIETGAARSQASPFKDILPYGLGYVVIEAVAALASRRKRSLYAKAVKAISKGQIISTAGALLQAMGAAHSTPQPPK